jgi:hypothetical protein
MENAGSGSDTEASGYESDSNKYNVDDAQLSDWDENDLTSWNSQSNKGINAGFYSNTSCNCCSR